MSTLLVLVGLGWLLYALSVRFPTGFARLIAEGRMRGGVTTVLSGRAAVDGRFRDRPVSMHCQRSGQDHPGFVIVTIRVAAPNMSIITARPTSETQKPDRDFERALFALEGKHGLRVDVQDGWLRATWLPPVFFFPVLFDRAKWQDILENLERTARGLEQRTGRGEPANQPRQ